MEKDFGPQYASVEDAGFIVKYRASCYCKAVQIEVGADPVDAKKAFMPTCHIFYGSSVIEIEFLRSN